MKDKPLALVDGDIFVVQSASKGEEKFEFAGGRTASRLDLDHAIANVEARIKSSLEVAETDRILIALSDPSRHYFRHGLYPDYKGNRRGSKPPVLRGDVRQYVEKSYPTVTKPRLEADDILGILGTKRDNCIIISTDKDMLQIPGRHINSDDLDRGVFEVTKEEGDLWHLIQTLWGDTVDNYKGLPGIGEKKAPPIAKLGWSAVVEAFTKKGYDEDYALLQARLAKILQVEDWDSHKQEPILWNPN